MVSKKQAPAIRIQRDQTLGSPIAKTAVVLATTTLCLAIAGCSSSPSGKKVKFSSAKYGVPASPRVVADGQPVPKGGGRAVVGKPYKVAGKTYRPKLDTDYEKVGLSSWYGPTFHGRLTANGEVFDKTSITAAHTTMPLPSYARVTNLENGRSLIVRVNDRGPFHGNREIDVSERAAGLLDFKRKGVAKVKVEYVGPARLDGRDEAYLLASYVGPGATTPGGTLPGTLLAQATPPVTFGNAAPVPQARPYLDATLVASAELPQQLELAAFDPAIAFEASASTIQIASANAFVPPLPEAQDGDAAAYAPGLPTDLRSFVAPAAFTPGVGPAREEPILGVLPASAPVPGFRRGAAVSSYAANVRVSLAYEALQLVGGGLPLKKLASNSTD
ncbi:septal ring lytic transglycosylase RlpA family protein [Stappia sp. F7233]|uniref:Endolytic peptidoglycan transglycosylase RlpA n=1 Tax=Stappia albiluteola TaxID=2758565 RepID=A0A839AAS3_9HYPH|nr:septal ring lytic transglycosylase RlpA family protein [Stappia albiluteola]MBA5776760.1 septal ring lytic transglycosylase RlpA family protein [Stappia albiluteola]